MIKYSLNICAILIINTLVLNVECNYLQFPIIRNPHTTKKLILAKSQCQDPITINDQVKYLQLCYEKDIAYLLQFDKNKKKYLLALDLTSPISWIKNQKTCQMISHNKKCHLLMESFGQDIKNKVKQKVNQLIKKLKKDTNEDDNKAIIQGSNQIIMGNVQKISNLSIIGKNSERLSNIFNMALMGLYIYGQNDQITLKQSTFIEASKITYNVNIIQDGAISMRIDQNSESSFITELFKNLKKPQNIISVYLGEKKLITIGGMSAKYSQCGLSQFVRIKLYQSDKYGKLPKIQAIILQNKQTQEDPITIQTQTQVIFTLSASYLGFSSQNINKIIKKFFPSFKCNINDQNYLQCDFINHKQDLQQILYSNIDLDFQTSMTYFSIKDLILQQHNNKIIFNIKKVIDNYTVVGQPFFLKHYVYFDYGNNYIGFAPIKLTLSQSVLEKITVIHFIVCIITLFCCFSFTSEIFINIYARLFWKFIKKGHDGISKLTKAYQRLQSQQTQDKQVQKPTQLEDIQKV